MSEHQTASGAPSRSPSPSPSPSADRPHGFRGDYRDDEDARAVYAEAAGIARAWPRAVAVPRDTEDVAVLVRWAHERGVPLIARGSGSGMSGGAVGDGIVVDLSRLRAIHDADPATRTIRAGVGVLRGEVHRRAGAAGLRFPVDPSSGEFCTIGGMVSTNAAGPRSLRHGPMRPWVHALECVFDDGSVATLRRGAPAPDDIPAIRRFLDGAGRAILATPRTDLPRHPGVIKESSGYGVAQFAQSQDLLDLLVGSEGTLAMFTAVELALVPDAGGRASVLVSFRDIAGAVDAAVLAREAGASACELLDGTFLRIAGAAGQPLPVSPDADAALLIETEGDDSAQARNLADAILEKCRRFGVLDAHAASEPAREAELWTLRHAASPAIARMDPALRSMQFIEDGAVPPERLAEYVRGVRAALDRAGTAGVIFGHAGDAHVHVNPLLDVSSNTWRDTVERILMDVTGLVAHLGGTTTGEHGDGRLRTPLMDRVWPAAALAAFSQVKQSFDPAVIFNPGVKVPVSGQRAVDVVKYDPAATPLPRRARAALDIVERERAYARFRLDLLRTA